MYDYVFRCEIYTGQDLESAHTGRTRMHLWWTADKICHLVYSADKICHLVYSADKICHLVYRADKICHLVYRADKICPLVYRADKICHLVYRADKICHLVYRADTQQWKRKSEQAGGEQRRHYVDRGRAEEALRRQGESRGGTT